MPLHFSLQPGPVERHLRRRADNPLFRRSFVTAAEVDAAREADAAALRRFMDDFHALVQAAAALAPNEESENVLALKARLDEAYTRCAALGGDQGRIREALRRLTDVVMRSVAVAAAGDPLARRELEQEAAAREQNYRLLGFPLVADLMLPDSPLPKDELVPSLLSEPVEAVEAALWLFDTDQALEMLNEARQLCDRLAAAGALPAGIEAKVALIERAATEGAPGARPN
jgi:hypothetical protein